MFCGEVAAVKNKGGRPSKLTKEMAEKIYFLAAKGLTDLEIATTVGIDESTLHRWKYSPEFCKSLKNSKEKIDEMVKTSLLSRALGYEYEEEFPTKDGAVMCKRRLHPDPTSCIFWLKNRKPEEFREKVEHEHAASDSLLAALNQIHEKR